MKGRLDPHARYRELLAARLDRQLTRAENRILLNHLKACPSCKQAERDYRDQGALLRSLPTPTPPRDLWARTSTALDREVSRWSPNAPRLRRRALARYAGSRTGSPNGLITVIAALIVVAGLAVFQYAPALRPQTTPPQDGATPVVRPTPFAINSQALAVISSNETDLTVYETDVNEVCPTNAPDCFDDREFHSRTVKLPKVRTQNVALSPNGGQLAVVGHNQDEDVIAVVMLRTDNQQRPPDVQPQKTPAPVATASPQVPPETPDVESSPSINPDETGQPGDRTESPDSSNEPTPDVASPESTDDQTDPGTSSQPQQVPTLGAVASPPASAVPGLTVVSILEDVHSAGMPPAWARNGEVLAFSAMPADGSHGPDVYVWRPGDGTAQPVTNDHSSYFASWSGRRIVASRVVGTDIATVVIDPQTLEERDVGGPRMWLPVVDPQRSNAITWSGDLDFTSGSPSPVSGSLYLVDWSLVDPFRDSGVSADSVELQEIDQSRDPAGEPVIDWHARWSSDGMVVGVWQADSLRASWGDLLVLAFDRDSGRLVTDDPLVNNKLAKRGFSLGDHRVAWVGRAADGADTELRIRTWGDGGVGDLRIDSLQLDELVPAF